MIDETELHSFGMVLVLALACADPAVDAVSADVYETGQAARWLGMEPLGGAYNPALAGCTRTATEGGDYSESLTWDALGRLVAQTHFTVSGDYDWTFEWDGPCRVAEDWETTVVDESSSDEAICDDNGWPIERTTVHTNSGADSEPRMYRYDNEYQGQELVRQTTTDPDGYESQETLEWADGRLTREADVYDDEEEVGSTSYTWRADGWIGTATVSSGDADRVAEYGYDEAGRLVTLASDGEVSATWTYDGEAQWPVLVEWGAGDEVHSADLNYACGG